MAITAQTLPCSPIEEKAVDALLDEHLVEVEGSNIPFIEQIADMTQDGEMLERLALPPGARGSIHGPNGYGRLDRFPADSRKAGPDGGRPTSGRVAASPTGHS